MVGCGRLGGGQMVTAVGFLSQGRNVVIKKDALGNKSFKFKVVLECNQT